MKIIAEIGSVHDGSFGNACNLIKEVSKAGADVVKFQMHIAEAESLPSAQSPPYFSTEPRLDYFKRINFTKEQWSDLYVLAKESKVEFMCSPFSIEAVNILEDIGVASYKLASGEVTNHPLLEKVASTDKPIYLSTGMANWDEIDAAVKILQKSKGTLCILQCSSIYPCPNERVGLNIIKELRDRYKVSVGFSDHTLGMAASIAAVAYGANTIEKHFTFSRSMYGSDAKNSMEPNEFADFCKELRAVFSMRNSIVDKNDVSPYVEMKKVFEKSIVTSRALKKGTVLTREILAFKKPGNGISAAKYNELIGKKVNRDLPKNYLLKEEDLI